MTKPLSKPMQDVLRNAVNHGQGWLTCRSDPIKTRKALFERGLLHRNGFLTYAGLQERAKLLPPQLVQTIHVHKEELIDQQSFNPARSRAVTLAKDAILDKARSYSATGRNMELSPATRILSLDTAEELFKLAEQLT